MYLGVSGAQLFSVRLPFHLSAVVIVPRAIQLAHGSVSPLSSEEVQLAHGCSPAACRGNLVQELLDLWGRF